MNKSKIKKMREVEIQLFDLWYENCDIGQNIISPIEKIFYLGFMRKIIEWGPAHCGAFEFMCIEPQVIILKDTGKIQFDGNPKGKKYYLVDFVVWFINKNIGTFDVVVELDGHEFHEKTKEQSKRDKKKDRFLQRCGYNIARFTGSEVFNDPDSCIEEVRKIGESEYRRKEKFIKRAAS